MGIVVFLVVVGIVLVGSVVFFRAVFGGSSFRPERGERRHGRNDDDAGRGPRPDVHAGNTQWTGGGGLGTWGTWNDTSGGS